jgi:hypothetical protein
VRITATKDKSESIVQAIQTTLQSVCSLTIDLNPLISGPESRKRGFKPPPGGAFDEVSMNELAQLTETHIIRLPYNQVSSTKSKSTILLLMVVGDLGIMHPYEARNAVIHKSRCCSSAFPHLVGPGKSNQIADNLQ